MKPRGVKGQARRSLGLSFRRLYSLFFIIPYLDGFVLACSRDKRLPDTHVHADNATGMVVQVDWLERELDSVLVIFVLDLACHKRAIVQQHQNLILVDADRTHLCVLVLIHKLFLVLLVFVLVDCDVFVGEDEPFAPVGCACCFDIERLLQGGFVVDDQRALAGQNQDALRGAEVAVGF